MAAPPPPEIPAAVGPFTVLGLRQATEDAQVVEARDPHGRRVDLVLLTGGISDDPAARDRFVAAAEQLFRADPSRVLGASPSGTRAWVAAPTGTGESLMAGLLAAARPPADQPAQGPSFAPYWRGRRSVVGWQEGLAHWSQEPTNRPWWRLWWLIAVFLLAMIALLLLFSQCAPPPPDVSPSPGSPGPTSPSSASPGSDSPGSGSGPSNPPTGSGSGSSSGASGSGSSSPTDAANGSGSNSSGPNGPGPRGTELPSPTNRA